MTVEDLIEILKKHPKDMLVAYEMYSEQCLLKEGDVEVRQLCLPRADGWVHDFRPDMPHTDYLVFPGN